MDAETLRAVVGQTGTLVLEHSGHVLSSTGELHGTHGERAAKIALSLLQDAGNVLDVSSKEVLQRLVVSFSSFDFVITHDNAQIYVVKRSKSHQSE